MLHKVKTVGMDCVYLEGLETSGRSFNSDYYIEAGEMNITSKMLADLNTAIQKVADESGSEIVRNLIMVEQIPPNSADYIFKGVIDLWAWFYAAGMEVKVNTQPDGNLLHKLIKVRIQDSLFAIIDLAESELEKLGVKR